MESKTEHLILCEMLSLASKADEIVEEYSLTLPTLNLKNIIFYEKYLRYTSHLKPSKITESIDLVVKSYINLSKELTNAH